MGKKQPADTENLDNLLGVSGDEESPDAAAPPDPAPAPEETVLEKQTRLAQLREQARMLLQHGTEDLRQKVNLEELQEKLKVAVARQNEATEMLGIATRDAKAAQLEVDHLNIAIAQADTRSPAEINQEYLNRTRDERFRKAALVQAQQAALMEQQSKLGLTNSQVRAVGHTVRSPLDQATAKKNIEARKQGLV